MGSPTEKQIKLVEKITEKLNIDFPICSQEFNSKIFYEFIKYFLPVLKDNGWFGDYYQGEDSVEEEIFQLWYDN